MFLFLFLCPRYAKDRPSEWPLYAQRFDQIYPRRSKDKLIIYLRYAKDMLIIYLRYVKDMFKICLDMLKLYLIYDYWFAANMQKIYFRYFKVVKGMSKIGSRYEQDIP